jgi:hypothetical protein
MLNPIDATVFEQSLDHGAKEAVREELQAIKDGLNGWYMRWYMHKIGRGGLWNLRAQKKEAAAASTAAAAAASSERTVVTSSKGKASRHSDTDSTTTDDTTTEDDG